MRAIVLTAVIAGVVGMSAGIWLKSTVLASAGVIAMQPAAAMSPLEMMRAAPRDLPVIEIIDPI